MFVGHNSNRVHPTDQSATMTGAVALGFERLERLFTRRRHASARKTRGRPRLDDFLEPPATPDEERITFPAPSFIKPTSSRMVAREEGAFTPRSARSSMSTRSRSVTAPSKSRASLGLSRRLSIPDSRRGSGVSSRYSTGSSVPRVPRRSSSLISDNRAGHSSLASLLHHEFTPLDSRNAERSLASLSAPARPRTSSAALETKGKEGPQSLIQEFPLPPRLDTPPPSDPEEGGSSSRPRLHSKFILRPPVQSQPTPEPSPSLPPLPEPALPLSRLEHIDLRPLLQRDSAESGGRSESQGAPAVSDESTEDTASTTASDPVMQEPGVREFLGLSDDDIAEPAVAAARISSSFSQTSESSTRPTTADAEARPRTPTSPPRKALLDLTTTPRTPPPATLPPSPRLIRRMSARMSVASADERAAATAAFEVARIATRFRFDLIYVISLWPQKTTRRRSRLPQFDAELFGSPLPTTPTAPLPPVPRRSSTMRYSRSSDQFETTMPDEQASGSTTAEEPESLKYRFLAAYGLHTVKPPLNIAYGVHSKILKSKGWIEYREPNPAENEFAHGYACSFYAGHAPANQDWRCGSLDSSCDADTEADAPSSPTSVAAALRNSAAAAAAGPRDTSRNNRGIVFAAYRKPRPDGSELAMDGAELKEMQRDAETLVDMILDFHTMKRRGEMLEKMRTSSVSSGGDALAVVQEAAVRPRTSA